VGLENISTASASWHNLQVDGHVASHDALHQRGFSARTKSGIVSWPKRYAIMNSIDTSGTPTTGLCDRSWRSDMPSAGRNSLTVICWNFALMTCSCAAAACVEM
jgi:hypothetical protein